jgi:hypothetical protein
MPSPAASISASSTSSASTVSRLKRDSKAAVTSFGSGPLKRVENFCKATSKADRSSVFRSPSLRHKFCCARIIAGIGLVAAILALRRTAETLKLCGRLFRTPGVAVGSTASSIAADGGTKMVLRTESSVVVDVAAATPSTIAGEDSPPLSGTCCNTSSAPCNRGELDPPYTGGKDSRMRLKTRDTSMRSCVAATSKGAESAPDQASFPTVPAEVVLRCRRYT